MVESAVPGTAQQFLLEDQAHWLRSRGVIALRGARAAEVVQPLLSRSLDTVSNKAVMAYALSDRDQIVADLLVVPVDDGLLLDCSRAHVEMITARLRDQTASSEVDIRDESDEWRVFAELPDQSTFDAGQPPIKYVDPRWHMGARLLRPNVPQESSSWGHENRYVGHACKLGVLPDANCLQNSDVTALEANLHAFGLVESDYLSDNSRKLLVDPANNLKRRLLPMRIEPSALALPTMTGLSVTAGDAEIGRVVLHQGLYGLVLTELTSWRKALQRATRLVCAEQTVLITWPTWLARESHGRSSPAGLEKR